MKARIIDDTIVEILAPVPGFDITDCYHADVLAGCIDTPPGAAVGWHRDDQGQWSAPPPPPRTWTAADLRSGLSLREKVAWDNDSAPEIVTAKIELSHPAARDTVSAVLDLLVSSNLIANTSMIAVLADNSVQS